VSVTVINPYLPIMYRTRVKCRRASASSSAAASSFFF
jgi:hypothetical protein